MMMMKGFLNTCSQICSPGEAKTLRNDTGRYDVTIMTLSRDTLETKILETAKQKTNKNNNNKTTKKKRKKERKKETHKKLAEPLRPPFKQNILLSSLMVVVGNKLQYLSNNSRIKTVNHIDV